MYTIVSVSAARRRFYRLSASRSSSLHKALNLFLSLSEQSLYRVLENSESVMVTVCVLCANECLPITNVTKDSPGRKEKNIARGIVPLCHCSHMMDFMCSVLNVLTFLRVICVNVSTHAAIDRLAADRGLTSATSLAFCSAVF